MEHLAQKSNIFQMVHIAIIQHHLPGKEGKEGGKKKSNSFLVHSNLKKPFQRFSVHFCFLSISIREELCYTYALADKSSVKQYLTYFFRENPKP